MLTLVHQIKQTSQLKWNRISKFRPKIKMAIELGPYLLKTAETQEELIESFKLRHEVFHREFQKVQKLGLDIDKYDCHFDHLIIVHQASQRIIGTYRVSCSEFSEMSYTAQEFDLSMIFKMRGPFLELGRACIQKEHRKGAVLSLLWRGIAEYMNQSQAQVLFGCSSIKISKARDAALVFKYLAEEGFVTTDILSRPTRSYLMEGFDIWLANFSLGLNAEEKAKAEELVPSLLKSYLKLGAKIACEPAFDKEFDCIDLLTVLRKEDLANSLARRFQVVR